MSAAETVAAGRALAESLMTDACEIRRPSTSSTELDDATGEYVTTPGALLYAGACRVVVPAAVEQLHAAGEHVWTTQRAVVSIPVSVTGISVGDELVITAAELDAELVGVTYRVTAEHHATHATARRLRCTEVTA